MTDTIPTFHPEPHFHIESEAKRPRIRFVTGYDKPIVVIDRATPDIVGGMREGNRDWMTGLIVFSDEVDIEPSIAI